MKIKRFVARDMKSALAQIKEELGADAVIMSNKKIAEGVEIMAAVDYNQSPSDHRTSTDTTESNIATTQTNRAIDNDVVNIKTAPMPAAKNSDAAAPADSLSALLQRQIQQEESQPAGHSTSVAASTKPAPNKSDDIEAQLRSFTERLQQNSAVPKDNSNHSSSYSSPQASFPQGGMANNTATASDNELTANTANGALPHEASRAPAAQTSAQASQTPEFLQMQQEMQSIRQLLEHQMSGLMWQDMAQKNPQKAVLINRLVGLGLTEQIADQIAGYIPLSANSDEVWEYAKKTLSQQLNTTNNDIIHSGGVVALVGPTGVGKTTTIAKLAARFAQIHGADQVALISTDSFRISGFEQLSTYGKIIGCQVKLANDAQALDELLQVYAKKKLVLIDTAGMGQRDMRLAQQLTTLISSARVRIRNYLVLSANTQQRVMQENVERFKKIPLAGCIYTKLDESLSVGEIIATSIQNGLPIGYLTDGQRVPEDIKVANVEKLVTLADKMALKSQQYESAWRPMPTTSEMIQ